MWKLSTLPGKTRLSGRNAGAAADASAISPGHEFSELAASASPAPSGSAELLPSVGRIMASRHTASRVYILSGGVNFSRGCQRRWKLFTAAEGAAGYATLARVWQPSRLRCEIGEPAATNKTRADVFFLEFSFFSVHFFSHGLSAACGTGWQNCMAGQEAVHGLERHTSLSLSAAPACCSVPALRQNFEPAGSSLLRSQRRSRALHRGQESVRLVGQGALRSMNFSKPLRVSLALLSVNESKQ